MNWLEAVTKILSESKMPLRAVDIARIAINDGLVEPDRTHFPEDNVRSAVSRHIKTAGNTLGFVIVKGDKSGSFYSLKAKQADAQ